MPFLSRVVRRFRLGTRPPRAIHLQFFEPLPVLVCRVVYIVFPRFFQVRPPCRFKLPRQHFQETRPNFVFGGVRACKARVNIDFR